MYTNHMYIQIRYKMNWYMHVLVTLMHVTTYVIYLTTIKQKEVIK